MPTARMLAKTMPVRLRKPSDADGQRLDPGQAVVVALRDVVLVAEILDRLVVQQAVDRLAVGDGTLGHRLALVRAQPLGADHQGHGVEGQRDDQDHGEDQVEAGQHDRGHEQHLGQQRQDQEHAVEQELARTVEALVEHAADLAGAASQMEAQGQGVQMLERMARQPPAGALLDRPVECPAQLAQHLGQPLHHHIGQYEGRGCDQQRRTRRQRIDGAREQERDQRVEQGGERQQRHRADDAPAQRRLGLAPEDAQDAAQRRTTIELARGRGLECAQLTRQGRVVLSGDGSCHKRAHLGNLEWCRVGWRAVRSPARPDCPLATTAKGTERWPRRQAGTARAARRARPPRWRTTWSSRRPVPWPRASRRRPRPCSRGLSACWTRPRSSPTGAAAPMVRLVLDRTAPAMQDMVKAESDLATFWLEMTRDQAQHTIETMQRLAGVRDWREALDAAERPICARAWRAWPRASRVS